MPVTLRQILETMVIDPAVFNSTINLWIEVVMTGESDPPGLKINAYEDDNGQPGAVYGQWQMVPK